MSPPLRRAVERLSKELADTKAKLAAMQKLDPLLSAINTEAELAGHANSYITLINGEKHYFLKGDWTPAIEVIATGLSNINRWHGQTNQPFSVAQHSLLVASLVPEAFALEALLHDAVEAYLGDCAKPLKRLLTQYQVIEDSHSKVIASYYGVPHVTSAVVKEADQKALLMENVAHRGGLDIGFSHEGVDTSNVWLKPQPAELIRDLFLEKFYKLYEVQNG